MLENRGTSLFLGRYSLNQVAAVLKKRNFFKDSKKRELWPLEFDLDSSEYPLQRFRIFHEKKKSENMIVDLKIKEGVFHLKKKLTLDFPISECNFLFLEWLTLQNPLLSFSEEKSPLPGQKHPGLGLGKKVMDVFIHLARITRKDGLIAFPAYFHNALLFSRYLYFINPEKTGEVQAIRETFPDLTFKQLAWIVHLNCMKDSEGKEYEWSAEEEVYPLNKKLKRYFDSKQYREIVEESKEHLSFQIDWERFNKKMKEIK
ncbi:MAG: hypothetical protein PVF66_08555 [Candidatus Aminicenantes bacterium]